VRPAGKCVSLLPVLYLLVKLTWRYGTIKLCFVATKGTKITKQIGTHPQLLTHHRAMHNACHGGIASYFAYPVD